MEYLAIFLVCEAVFVTSGSETCLDVRFVNYTIQCNFENCRIPGEYCDDADPDSLRCSTCDEDVCNDKPVPGECTIPCLSEYDIVEYTVKLCYIWYNKCN